MGRRKKKEIVRVGSTANLSAEILARRWCQW